MEWTEYRNTVKCPVLLNAPPVVEAVVEIRFLPEIPEEAVFGITFDTIRGLFNWSIEELPILEIPGSIRKQDPSLIYQPHYRLRSENFVVQIGPRVISFACVSPYVGWNAFFEMVASLVDPLEGRSIFGEIERVGVRFINYFAQDVREKIILQIAGSDVHFKPDTLNLTSAFSYANCSSKIKIASDATFNLSGTATRGSLVDIDVFRKGFNDGDGLKDLIQELHSEEKKDFFALLKPDYIELLGPKYAD